MLIQTYQLGEGGFADMLRSIFAYYTFCQMNDIKYYVHFNGKLGLCFDLERISDRPYKLFIDIGSKSTERTQYFLKDIKNNKDECFVVRSNIFDFVSFDDLKKYRESFLKFMKLSDVVKNRIINNKVINELNEFNKELNKFKELTAIHVRCGDKYMNHVNIESDSRMNPEKAIEIINKMINNKIIIFSDNEQVRKEFKDHIVFNEIVEHTALTDADIVDTVAEFFIMMSCKKIIALTNSGFSFWASFLGLIPLVDENDNERMLKY